MSSAEKAKQIIDLLAQVDTLITAYREEVQQEVYDLSEYDKFDQDALHLIEHVNFNAPESAKLIKKWGQIRTQRRIAKDNIFLAQELQPKFEAIQQQLRGLEVRTSNRKYSIRTDEMREIAQPFYEKNRLDATIFRPSPIQEEPPIDVAILYDDVDVEEPSEELVAENDTPAEMRVVLGKKGWELKRANEVIFQNKKLSVVVDEIYAHAYDVHVDKAHRKVVDALLQKKREQAAVQ